MINLQHSMKLLILFVHLKPLLPRCHQKSISASKIIPLSKSLLMITSQKTNKLSTKLFYRMKAQFLNVEGNQLLASSTILNPQFKKFTFSDQNAAEKIARATVAQCSSLDNSGNDTDSNVENSGEVSVNPLWQFFDQRVAEVRAATTSNRCLY